MQDRESPQRRIAQRSVSIAIALALSGLPVVAQSKAQVSWQARHGLGGVHRPGGVLPVAVRLESHGDRNLQLRLESSMAMGRVVREIELPPGSRKELTLYLAPLQLEQEITVELNQANGLQIGEMTLPTEPVGMSDLVVGIIGDHPLGWNLWKHDQVRRVHLRALDLPGAADGLTSLDVLAWAAPETGHLKAEQIRAIGEWTERGGMLVLALGPSWLESSTGAFDAWTRIRATTLFPTTSLRPIERIVKTEIGLLDPPLAVARLDSRDGQTWLEDQHGALAAIERRGLGSVVVLGPDPSAPQLADWAGWNRFWFEVVRRAGLRVSFEPEPAHGRARGFFGNRVDIGTVYQRFVSVDPRINLPSFGWLTIWFVGYLLIIGPLEYLLLKRFNRLAWTWITFPTVALVFALGSYQFALANRGPARQQARQLRTLDLLPESGVFVDRLNAGLFVERQGTIGISADARWPVARSVVTLFSPEWRGSGLPWQHERVYEQYPASLNAKMPKWSWLIGTFSGTTPSGGASVDGALRIDGNMLGGSITLALGRQFAETRIVALSAGQPLVFSLDHVPDGVTTVLSAVGRPVDASWQDLPRSGSPEELFRRVMYETVREIAATVGQGPDRPPDRSHDWSRLLRAGGAVLLAWAEDDQSHIRSEGRRVASSGITILRVPVEPGMVER